MPRKKKQTFGAVGLAVTVACHCVPRRDQGLVPIPECSTCDGTLVQWVLVDIDPMEAVAEVLGKRSAKTAATGIMEALDSKGFEQLST